MIALVLSVAFAQQEVCDDVFTHEAFATEMDQVDAALSAVDLETARDELKGIHKGLLCMEEPARPSYLSRFFKQLAITFFFDQDEVSIRRWGQAAAFADPEAPWPSDVGLDHPLRELLAGFGEPAMRGPDEGLSVPKKGAYLASGRPLLEAKAPVEVPIFVQIADKQGAVVRQFWQDGSAFPEDQLGGPKRLSPPKWYTPETERMAISDPLWGTAEVEEVEIEVSEPAPPAEVITRVSSVGEYVDPFEDARLRTIARERHVREETTASGDTRTVTTDVITLVEDTGPVTAVTQDDFAAWIAYRPDFQPDRLGKDQADSRYLKTWKGEPPDPSAPVTWVSFVVAKAYCDDWGGGLADVGVLDPKPTMREWRLSGDEPAVVGPEGNQDVPELTATAGDLGFRCSR